MRGVGCGGEDVDGAEKEGAFEGLDCFGEDLVEEEKLGGDEGGGGRVACPAGYVDAVEGLVEEGAEVG